jgi:uncharacterized repeat protein (TIGR01451 family)
VTISFQVTINSPLPAGVTQVSNQGLVGSNELPDEPTDDPDTPPEDDETRTHIEAEPVIEAYKTDFLLVDADDSDNVSPGDTLLYNVTILNSGNQAAADVRFTDPLTDPYLSLVTGTVQTNLGAVITGNNVGDVEVVVDVDTLPAGSSAKISFRVLIDIAIPVDVDRVINQGVISGTNFTPEPTDDPNTPEDDDDTEVPVTPSRCQVPADDYEPDSLYTQATQIITYGLALTRTFHTVSDKDWVQFYGWANRVYTITTLHLDADVDTILQLYDVDGANLLRENDDYQLGSKASQIGWTSPADGWYFARVTHFDRTYDPSESEICGNYYQVMVDVAPCSIAVDTYEPDSLYTQAASIPTNGKAVTRTFEAAADKDWVSFEAVAGQVYTITTLNLGTAIDTVIQLYDTDGVTLIDENDDYQSDSEASRLVWTAPKDGEYFVRVAHFDRTYDPNTTPVCGNSYQIAVETPLCELPDPYEPDQYYTDAFEIPTTGQVYTRAFNAPADKDWVKFYARTGQVYTITTAYVDADVDTVLQLYDLDGKTLLLSNDDYEPDSRSSRLQWTAPQDGWYFVRVTHFDHTYDPRYVLVCGSRYTISVEQEILGVTKTVSNLKTVYEVGDTVDYVIVVWNKLNTIQTNVVITDYIPAKTIYVPNSAKTTQGTVLGTDPLVINAGKLAVDGRITVTFQVEIGRGVSGQILNQAKVKTDQHVTEATTPFAAIEVLSHVYVPLIYKGF